MACASPDNRKRPVEGEHLAIITYVLRCRLSERWARTFDLVGDLIGVDAVIVGPTVALARHQLPAALQHREPIAECRVLVEEITRACAALHFSRRGGRQSCVVWACPQDARSFEIAGACPGRPAVGLGDAVRWVGMVRSLLGLIALCAACGRVGIYIITGNSAGELTQSSMHLRRRIATARHPRPHA